MKSSDSDLAMAPEALLRVLRGADEQARLEAARRIDSDPTLRAQVERLLAATVDSLPAGERASHYPLRQIGPYRMLRELGSGGMGAVFLAERDVDGTLQRVALKLLHGIPTLDGRRRFARERALLAGLNHPNIAALLDGGETEQGQPYLVMEYVDGVPISDWVRQRRPTLAERLRVLQRVCGAVQHAHQRLVLHRDIKPGNILVDAEGEPVLLDFGIAKVLDQTDARSDTATLAFTPAYAAPEQQVGRGLTTATDVYGLGAVLYELLSECSLAELRLQPGALPAPSTQVGDPQRARLLRGDLDRMVAKAMHLEPERRYPSPAALAEDIERFLSGRPVQATPDSLAYRVRKFLSRHRAASVITAVALLLIGAAVWRLDVERTRALAAEARAQSEAASARRARDFLVSVFASAAPAETLGEPVTPRALLDKARAKVEQELGGDPASAVATWMALADTYAALGAPDAAAQAAEQALRYTPVDAADGGRQRAIVLEALAAAYNNLGRHDEAAPLQAELLRWRERASADDPAALMNTYAELAYGAQARGEFEQSEQLFGQALQQMQTLQASRPISAADQAYVQAGLAVSAGARGDLARAERALQQAEQQASQMDPRDPARLYVLRARSRIEEYAGRFEQSLAILQDASALATRVVGADASVVAGIENDLGVALNGLGRFREALQHLQQARASYERLEQVGPANLAFIDANISALYESLGDYEQAIRYGRRALAVYESLGVGNADMLRQSRVNLARALSFAGQHAEALTQMRTALAQGQQQEGEASLVVQLDRFRYAGILRRAGELDEAAGVLKTSGAALSETLGAEHPVQLHLLRLQALIARDRGQRAAAIRAYEQTLAFAERTPESDRVAAAEARVELAELLADSEGERARQLLAAALPVLREALLPIAPALQRAEQLQQQLPEKAG